MKKKKILDTGQFFTLYSIFAEKKRYSSKKLWQLLCPLQFVDEKIGITLKEQKEQKDNFPIK